MSYDEAQLVNDMLNSLSVETLKEIGYLDAKYKEPERRIGLNEAQEIMMKRLETEPTYNRPETQTTTLSSKMLAEKTAERIRRIRKKYIPVTERFQKGAMGLPSDVARDMKAQIFEEIKEARAANGVSDNRVIKPAVVKSSNIDQVATLEKFGPRYANKKRRRFLPTGQPNRLYETDAKMDIVELSDMDEEELVSRKRGRINNIEGSNKRPKPGRYDDEGFLIPPPPPRGPPKLPARPSAKKARELLGDKISMEQEVMLLAKQLNEMWTEIFNSDMSLEEKTQTIISSSLNLIDEQFVNKLYREGLEGLIMDEIDAYAVANPQYANAGTIAKLLKEAMPNRFDTGVMDMMNPNLLQNQMYDYNLLSELGNQNITDSISQTYNFSEVNNPIIFDPMPEYDRLILQQDEQMIQNLMNIDDGKTITRKPKTKSRKITDETLMDVYDDNDVYVDDNPIIRIPKTKSRKKTLDDFVEPIPQKKVQELQPQPKPLPATEPIVVNTTPPPQPLTFNVGYIDEDPFGVYDLDQDRPSNMDLLDNMIANIPDESKEAKIAKDKIKQLELQQLMAQTEAKEFKQDQDVEISPKEQGISWNDFRTQMKKYNLTMKQLSKIYKGKKRLEDFILKKFKGKPMRRIEEEKEFAKMAKEYFEKQRERQRQIQELMSSDEDDELDPTEDEEDPLEGINVGNTLADVVNRVKSKIKKGSVRKPKQIDLVKEMDFLEQAKKQLKDTDLGLDEGKRILKKIEKLRKSKTKSKPKSKTKTPTTGYIERIKRGETPPGRQPIPKNLPQNWRDFRTAMKGKGYTMTELSAIYKKHKKSKPEKTKKVKAVKPKKTKKVKSVKSKSQKWIDDESEWLSEQKNALEYDKAYSGTTQYGKDMIKKIDAIREKKSKPKKTKKVKAVSEPVGRVEAKDIYDYFAMGRWLEKALDAERERGVNADSIIMKKFTKKQLENFVKFAKEKGYEDRRRTEILRISKLLKLCPLTTDQRQRLYYIYSETLNAPKKTKRVYDLINEGVNNMLKALKITDSNYSSYDAPYFGTRLEYISGKVFRECPTLLSSILDLMLDLALNRNNYSKAISRKIDFSSVRLLTTELQKIQDSMKKKT